MKHLKIDTDILYKVQKRFKDNTVSVELYIYNLWWNGIYPDY